MLSAMHAQSAKSVGLSDSDVKNWAKNCVSIQKEFEKLGIDTNDSFTVSASEKQNAETILQKNGISNPNIPISCSMPKMIILICPTGKWPVLSFRMPRRTVKSGKSN